MKKNFSTQKTIETLTRRGFKAASIERWVYIKRIFQDCFGLYDVLALKPGEGVFLIQSTEPGGMGARRGKMLKDPVLVFCLMCGVRVQLWCCSREPVGPDRAKWEIRVEEAFLNSAGVPEFREAEVPETKRQQNRAVELDYCI